MADVTFLTDELLSVPDCVTLRDGAALVLREVEALVLRCVAAVVLRDDVAAVVLRDDVAAALRSGESVDLFDLLDAVELVVLRLALRLAASARSVDLLKLLSHPPPLILRFGV